MKLRLGAADCSCWLGLPETRSGGRWCRAKGRARPWTSGSSGWVAITAAYTTNAPYCIAANTEYEPTGLSEAELDALRSGADESQVASFTPREQLAIRYARLISATPLEFPEDFVAELTSVFTEREIVTLASAAAAINFNARLIEALGAPAPEFRSPTRRR